MGTWVETIVGKGKKHTRPTVGRKCFTSVTQACCKMQQIYNSSDMWYLWFAVKCRQLKNDQLVLLQYNRDAECLGFDGFINKIFFPPTAAQLTVLLNRLKSKDGEEKPSRRNVAILVLPQGYYYPACPSQLSFQVFTNAILKRKDASDENMFCLAKLRQNCEIKH